MDRCAIGPWRDLWRRLGARADPDPAHDALRRAYAEPHRHYHTAEHIARALGLLDGVRDRLDRPDEAELALWLHDVVYDPRADDNEARSAEWAAAMLAAAGGADPAAIARVRGLILATRHAAPPDDPDARHVVDADLAILGAGETEFERYERQVRREFAFVPEPLWRERRTRLLRRFLERPRLFETAAFARLEAAARANLRRSLARLEADGA